jgi:hypothetical protein
MKPLSRKDRHVESTLVRLAYIPLMAAMVAGIVVFWWPVLAWSDYWLRRAWRRRWGRDQGRVVIPFEPGTPWHEAVIARWIPRYGDRTSLVDLTTLKPKSRSLEDRVYRRWRPHYPFYVRPPIMIGIPPRGRVATVSFAEVLDDPAQLDRRLSEVASLTFGDGLDC